MSEREPINFKINTNPFALASNTSFRFFIFIIFILGATFQISRLLVHLPDRLKGIKPDQSEASKCVSEWAIETLPKITSPFSDAISPPEIFDALKGCITLLSLSTFFVVSMTFLGMAVVTTLLFAIPPWWYEWRGHVRPLPLDRHIALGKALQHIERDAGLRTSPRYVWQPLANDLPRVFAGFGRIQVYLSGKFVADRNDNPEVFRSVLLHEFAHIQNRDIRIASITEALWWAFVLCVLVPAVLHYAISFSQEMALLKWTWLVNSGQLIAIAALAYAFRCAILRARESESDLQAARDGKSKEALIDRLTPEQSDRPKPSPRKALIPEPLRRIFSDHPSDEWRVKVIEDPQLIFMASSGDFFLVGFAFVLFIGVPVSTFFALIRTDLNFSNPLILTFALGLPLLFYAALIVMTFGIAIARERFAAVVGGDLGRFRGAGRLALGASIGIIAGFISLPVIGELYFGFQMPNTPFEDLVLELDVGTLIIIHIFIFLIYFTSFLMMFRWLQRCVDSWLPIITTIEQLNRARLIGFLLLMAAALLISVLPASLIVVDLMIKSFLQMISPGAVLGFFAFPSFLIPINPMTALAIIAAGFIPFGAAIITWRKEIFNLADWVYWSKLPRSALAKVRRPALRPIRAIAVGLAVGILAIISFPSPETALNQIQTIEGYLTFNSKGEAQSLAKASIKYAPLIWIICQYVIFSSISILLAAIVCPFMGTSHGIVAGCITLLAIIIFVSLARTGSDWLFVPIGLNLAFILSLPLLALISGCKSIFQLLRRSIPQTQ